MSYDYLIKIIVIGDANVGKSSIIKVFENKEWDMNDSYLTTIGVEFSSYHFTIKDTIFKMHVWDTAGQERFQSITDSYYKHSIGYILVFDLSDRHTFFNLKDWKSKIDSKCSEKNIGILVGNKSDLDKEVSKDEITEFVKDNDLIYIETSAKKNINVDTIFTLLVNEIYNKFVVKEDMIDGIRKNHYVNLSEFNYNKYSYNMYDCCNII